MCSQNVYRNAEDYRHAMWTQTLTLSPTNHEATLISPLGRSPAGEPQVTNSSYDLGLFRDGSDNCLTDRTEIPALLASSFCKIFHYDRNAVHFDDTVRIALLSVRSESQYLYDSTGP